jgi:hypothetical protein
MGWGRLRDMLSSLFVRDDGMDQRRVLPFHRDVQQTIRHSQGPASFVPEAAAINNHPRAATTAAAKAHDVHDVHSQTSTTDLDSGPYHAVSKRWLAYCGAHVIIQRQTPPAAKRQCVEPGTGLNRLPVRALTCPHTRFSAQTLEAPRLLDGPKRPSRLEIRPHRQPVSHEEG